MAYKAPVRDLTFILNEVLEIDRYANQPGFADVSSDLADQIGRDVGEAGLVGITVDLQHLVQDERQVADRRLVGHGTTLSL